MTADARSPSKTYNKLGTTSCSLSVRDLSGDVRVNQNSMLWGRGGTDCVLELHILFFPSLVFLVAGPHIPPLLLPRLNAPEA